MIKSKFLNFCILTLFFLFSSLNFINLSFLYAQQIKLPDISRKAQEVIKSQEKSEVKEEPRPINVNQSEIDIRKELYSVEIDSYPAAVDYYGQRIKVLVPYGIPILIDLPDYIIDKTVEVAVSGLMVLPQGKEQTSILRILSTKNITFDTVIHVTLANGLVITFEVKLLQNDGSFDVRNVETRYKIIDHITENLKIKSSMEKIVDSPELVNFMADKVAYRQLLSLAGIYEYYPVKKQHMVLAEDDEKSIYISSYNLANVNIVFRTDFRGRDRKIPVLLFGLKTFYCNKNKFNFLSLNIDYIKYVFNSYYKISFNKNKDSIIPPDSCVPVYIILWEGIEKL
jgi:hypothetical protein